MVIDIRLVHTSVPHGVRGEFGCDESDRAGLLPDRRYFASVTTL